jgi:hypothetical protein
LSGYDDDTGVAQRLEPLDDLVRVDLLVCHLDPRIVEHQLAYVAGAQGGLQRAQRPVGVAQKNAGSPMQSTTAAASSNSRSRV